MDADQDAVMVNGAAQRATTNGPGNGAVTPQFLRRRFWSATLVVLLTLSVAAIVVVLVAQRQADRANYVIAYERLGNAAMHLDREFARLEASGAGEAPDRAQARAAFTDLLIEFRAIAYAAHNSNSGAEGAAVGRTSDHLEDLDAEFGIDASAAAAARELRLGAMCDKLSEVWNGTRAEAGPAGIAGLEVAVGSLLRASLPIVRDEGALTSAEHARLATIDALIRDDLGPTLKSVSLMLATALNRANGRATIYIAILSAIGIATALLNFIWILRPLGRSVLASQAQIIAERDRAVAADHAKRNFLSVVSHELRTPMNGVLGFASLLLASDLKPEHRKQVQIIQSSGKTLLALVNDILDFSKLEAGSLELVDEDFSIEDTIGGVVTLLRGAAVEKQLEIGVYFDLQLPDRTRGDAARLGQILTNLIGNAIKFTDRGNIGIEAHLVSPDREGGDVELQIAVSDTGIGIPPDKLDLIFERFTQVESGARRKHEGTGLGLAICRELATRMDGRIWAESTPEVGSTFFLRLPLKAPAEGGTGPGWREEAAAVLAGRRVLVVDDHSVNRRILRLQLESCGLRVDDADGAAEALRLLGAAVDLGEPYMVAVIDHMMPGIDGAELAQRIRADRRFDELRLLLSSSAASLASEEMRTLGFDAAAEKPILPKALIGAIRDLAGPAKALRPSVPTATQTATHEVVQGVLSAGAEKVHILVADDNAAGREMVQEMLTRARYKVDVVENGLAALRAAQRLPYDLILMDIRMPVMGGIEAARRIRELDGAGANVPILALTPNAEADDIADYRAAGMQDVIVKPHDQDTLLGAVAAVLEASGRARGPVLRAFPRAVPPAAATGGGENGVAPDGSETTPAVAELRRFPGAAGT